MSSERSWSLGVLREGNPNPNRVLCVSGKLCLVGVVLQNNSDKTKKEHRFVCFVCFVTTARSCQIVIWSAHNGAYFPFFLGELFSVKSMLRYFEQNLFY